MARKFSTPIDMQQLELLQSVLENRASNPSTGKEGQVYYNTSTDKLMVCTATGTPGTWTAVLFGPVTSADITDGTIVNIDVAAAAAIAYSKLNLAASIVNADVAAAAAIAQSKLALSITNTEVNAAAAIAESKLALATDAAAGTGSRRTLGTGATQAAPGNHTLASHPAPVVALAMNAQKITGLADPTSAQDAATKAYVDGVASGLDVKGSVRAASVANMSLSGAATVDGVTLANGDRFLAKDQTTPSFNGIYVVNTGGAWPRATDADSSAEVTGGMFTFVEEGTVNADTGWVLTNDGAITVGTTSLAFAQFTGAGSIVAGAALSKTGNTLDVNVNTGATGGLEILADALQIKALGVTAAMLGNSSVDVSAGAGKVTGALPIANGGTGQTTAAAARTALGVPGKYTTTTGLAGAGVTITAGTHGLGSGQAKIVQVYDASSGDLIECDVTIAISGDVTIASALVIASVVITIIG